MVLLYVYLTVAVVAFLLLLIGLVASGVMKGGVAGFHATVTDWAFTLTAITLISLIWPVTCGYALWDNLMDMWRKRHET